jgi:hypothetical protein
VLNLGALDRIKTTSSADCLVCCSPGFAERIDLSLVSRTNADRKYVHLEPACPTRSKKPPAIFTVALLCRGSSFLSRKVQVRPGSAGPSLTAYARSGWQPRQPVAMAPGTGPAERKAEKSYLSSAVESINPWGGSRSTTPTPRDDIRNAAPPPVTVDHSTTHLYGRSQKCYPADCPELNILWFHAVDVS